MNENDISQSQNQKNVLHVIIEKRRSFKNFKKIKNFFTLNEFILTKNEKKGLIIFSHLQKKPAKNQKIIIKN